MVVEDRERDDDPGRYSAGELLWGLVRGALPPGAEQDEVRVPDDPASLLDGSLPPPPV
jgi:hypothetical protein